MTTIPNVRTDTRLSYWRKILVKYQNQTNADARNNLRMSEPLRRVQVKVLQAISGAQADHYPKSTLRRLEGKMVRAVIKQ
jgi:hypothetical protein